VPFFEVDQIAAQVIEALTHPRRFRSIRTQARRTILDEYDLERICLPKLMAFVRDKEPRQSARQSKTRSWIQNPAGMYI